MPATVVDAPARAPSDSVIEQHPTRRPSERLSVAESLIRGVLANISAKPLTAASGLLAATVVPHFLGSAALGQMTLAFTISMLAGTALDLGVPTFLSRRIAQNAGSAERDLGVALVLQFTIYTLGAIAIAVIAPIVSPALLDFRLLYWALFGIVTGCAQSVLLAALRGNEHHVRYAWLAALPVVVSAVGAALALFLGADVLVYTALGIVLDIPCIALAWRISGLRPAWPRIEPALLREGASMIRGGLPFVGLSVIMAIYGGIDRVLLGLMVPASEIGWYAAAYRIIGVPIFVPTLLITPLFPVLSRSAHDPDSVRKAVLQTLRITLFFSVPLGAAICVFAPVIPPLLHWSDDFANTVPLMRILAVQLPVVSLDIVLGTVIMALGRERAWVRVGVVAAALNVATNLILIPFFEQSANNGAIGASIATVTTEIALLIGALVVTPTGVLCAELVWQAARIASATLVAAALAIVLFQINFFAAFVVGCSAFAILTIVLGVVTPQDVRFVTRRSFAS